MKRKYIKLKHKRNNKDNQESNNNKNMKNNYKIQRNLNHKYQMIVQQLKMIVIIFKQEQSLNRDDSQEIIKSQGGLRSLMQKSKERDQKFSTSQSKQNLNLSNQQKKQQYQPYKEQLGQFKNQNVATGGRKSRTQQQKYQQDQNAEEIVYQLDEDGYLMDENGNYLLDEKGNYIQISDKDLEELKKQNLVIEQE
ncbi:unnamed protein product [Paramecium pentaurelia]|uniref:Uncharacterized protein n=1 Tax=Paramecium pentaurelia TaxID=43138 RepID=A0A8S1YD65_9CILI|nr:unnamed protein product [Paramecium pentaurelia]